MKFSKEDIQKIGDALGAETYDFGNKYMFRVSNSLEKRRLQMELYHNVTFRSDIDNMITVSVYPQLIGGGICSQLTMNGCSEYQIVDGNQVHFLNSIDERKMVLQIRKDAIAIAFINK
ncbi:MAG: hypothetical protein HY731_06665 [Candidatus Tectomicrobia bacterium]|nr:hypothetical protein [Candidatus Tectomicrobia bacterium]